MQVPMLDLKAQYRSYREEAMEAIAEVCQSQAFALGPAVKAFEEEIAAYCGCKYAIGVSSGTDALLVSLMALGVGPGDEVITSAFSFFASAGSIARVGAVPVFVDVEAETFNIDPAGVEEKVGEKTKAILPVHLFGQMAQMKPIMEIAARRNLRVVEDAAQAMGASQEGRGAGTVGDYGCFSFYPTKNLSCFGDGGLVVTNDEGLAEKVRVLRNHGQKPPYFYRVIGGNFRLDSIQAAVLSVKLKYLDEWNRRRRRHARLYDELFAGSCIKSPRIEPNNVSTYHQYTVIVPERDELRKFLAAHDIGSAVFYPRPLHMQECFRELGYRRGELPVAERLCEEVLSLPMYPELTDEQIEYVAATTLKFYGLD